MCSYHEHVQQHQDQSWKVTLTLTNTAYSLPYPPSSNPALPRVDVMNLWQTTREDMRYSWTPPCECFQSLLAAITSCVWCQLKHPAIHSQWHSLGGSTDDIIIWLHNRSSLVPGWLLRWLHKGNKQETLVFLLENRSRRGINWAENNGANKY